MLHRILRPFVAGLLAALPLALTVAAVLWLADLVHRFLGPASAFGKLLGSIGLKFVTSDVVAYVIGFGVVLTVIYLLGLAVEAGMKNRWNMLVDTVMDRLPLIKSVYHVLRKLMAMFESRDQSEMKSMSAVMCRFGGGESSSVLALLPSSEPVRFRGRDYYAVLIPTAPVPFGGAILYVPLEWVEPVDIAFEGLLNIYMSMGATSAEYFGKRQGESPVENVPSPDPEPAPPRA